MERILSLSAVGSLKEEHKPLDFVIPDQFFDRTRGRVSTFFGEGLVAHVSFADPVCPQLAEVVRGRPATKRAWSPAKGGTYLCMEGSGVFDQGRIERLPQLGHGRDRHDQPAGSQARARGRDLLRHLAMVTDYDCWHAEHDAVTVTDIIANLTQNAENACKVVAAAVAAMPEERACKCGSALAHALITDPKTIPEPRARSWSCWLENTSAEEAARELLGLSEGQPQGRAAARPADAAEAGARCSASWWSGSAICSSRVSATVYAELFAE